MKKPISILLLCTLLLSCVSVFAASKNKVKPNTYSMPTEGSVVLQNNEDRSIKPKTDFVRRPIIGGESPTTGLPWEPDSRGYLPMIVQISNPEGSVKVDGKSVNSAGIGQHAPWSGQYVDVMFEGIRTRTGITRISFLFNDSFSKQELAPESVGPVRSARIGQFLLREEWQSGFVYAGGPRRPDVIEVYARTDMDDKGVLFDLLSGSFVEFKNLVSGIRAPDNLNANLVGLRSKIPASYTAEPRAFLFSDESPYTDGYEFAYDINLDWGDEKYISHYYYDEAEKLYLRFSGDAPYMTYTSADDRADERAEQMSFANVIIQRVPYEYVNNIKIMPNMLSVGQGNADIFIGGRYIPGYWICKSVGDPPIFLDDKGNELHFARGKTYIAHFPPESLCTYTGVE